LSVVIEPPAVLSKKQRASFVPVLSDRAPLSSVTFVDQYPRQGFHWGSVKYGGPS
jgi:hypothetical protein